MRRVALWLLLAALGCDRPAPAPPVPPAPRTYPAGHVPATFDDAVTYLCETLDDAARERVRRTPEWDLVTLNWGWGRGLRNELRLLDADSALRGSCAARAGRPALTPDEASRMLIEAVWRRLRQ